MLSSIQNICEVCGASVAALLKVEEGKPAEEISSQMPKHLEWHESLVTPND